jgi:hypothetical protein
MTKKIKSITVKKDLPGFKAGSKLLPYLNYTGRWGYSDLDNSYTVEYMRKHTDYFEIEYEPPKILKRPDGSVISGLEVEEGNDLWFIAQYNDCFLEKEGWHSNSPYCKTALAQGKVFQIKDKHLAEKKVEMLSKQLEIQYEIDRLNAEEAKKTGQVWSLAIGWVGEIEKCAIPYYSGETRMSEETAETILAKYSQDELKQYLGIII